MKLTNYIFADHSFLPSGPKSEPLIERSLALTILRASITKFTDCLNDPHIVNSIKCILSKGKKFMKELEDTSDRIITKDELLNIVLKNKTATLDVD